MDSNLFPSEVSVAIKEEAYRLGFDLCRIIPVGEAPHANFFQGWLALERAGEMHYLARNTDKRRNPALLSEDQGNVPFHSMIVLAVNHYQFMLTPEIMGDPSRGVIASYAWGDDYHEIIRPALHKLDYAIRAFSGRTAQGKCLVDSGPILERDWAHQAGLGFTGKNCCTIHPQLGSWLLLATVLVPERLTTDSSIRADPSEPSIRNQQIVSEQAILAGLPQAEEYGRWEMELTVTGSSDLVNDSQMVTCGRCTRCLDECPTDAFVGPYHLDPLRCISYWTIESRKAIPRELRTHFGNRIFGCDICQEVCPWNSRLEERTPLMVGLSAQSERIAPPLLEGFACDTPYWLNQEAFSRRFRRSPIKRAKRSGMLRNVCVALGNWGHPSSVDALAAALRDEDPLPRGHAAWGLGRILLAHNHEQSRTILTEALETEENAWVRDEIDLALH